MTGGEPGLARPAVARRGGSGRALAHLVSVALLLALLVAGLLAGIMWILAALLHHAATA
jgi:hypothetical protein